MAEKYPFLRERKTHVISIDASTWNISDAERAVVATHERRHVTVYVDREDGTWASVDRRWQAIDRRPRSPRGIIDSNWGGQIGLVTEGDLLGVCYKRRIDGRTALWFDRLAFDGQNLTPISDPIPLPLDALRMVRVGFGVRCGYASDQLRIVVQTMTDQGRIQLTLLSSKSMLEDLSDDPGTWEADMLDLGGYDFDAVFDNHLVEVVHRRTPGAITIPRREMPTPDNALLLNDPTVPIPQLEDMVAPLVRVTVDTSVQSLRVDDQLPHMEHPQILRREPFLVAGDRLVLGMLRTNFDDDEDSGTLRFDTSTAVKIVAREFEDTWPVGELFAIQPDRVPRHLQELRGAQLLIGRDDTTISLASLMPQHTVALLGDNHDEKSDRIVLAHELRRFGVLAATTFTLTHQLDPPSTDVSREGFTALDIGREQIGDVGGVPHRAENEQFEPVSSLGPHDHIDGFRIRGPQRYVNTMGGGVVVARDGGSRSYAYVDMGDAGLRVVHGSRVTPPDSTAPWDAKSFTPDIVSGPGGEDRVWIDLSAAQLTRTGVPAYRAPYAEIVRGVAGDDGVLSGLEVLALALLFAGPLAVNFYEPRSLHGVLQPSLDLLPLAIAITTPGWSVAVDGEPLDATSVVLTPLETTAVETFLADNSGNAETGSADDDAFAVTIRQSPATVFPGTPVTFSAIGPDDATFAWSITNQAPIGAIPTLAPFTWTATGPSATETYIAAGSETVTLTATRPDGTSVTVTRNVRTSESLWNTLWVPFDSVATDEFQLGALNLDLFQYTIGYQLDGGGRRLSVQLDWKSSMNASHRFIGSTGGQGRIDYGIQIAFDSTSATLTGFLGGIAQIDSIEGQLRYGREFAPSVLTRDRRRTDPVRERTFDPRIETVQTRTEDPIRAISAPAALAMKPLAGSSIALESNNISTSLAPPARNIAWLIAAIIGLGLLVALLAAAGVAAIAGAAVTVVASLAIGAIVNLIVVAGLAALIIEVAAPAIIQWIAEDQFRKRLDAALPGIRDSLDDQNLLRYAGEGLAEGLAGQVIDTARAEGIDIPAPAREGRDRFRGAFFETIVVGDGVARVLVRVVD